MAQLLRHPLSLDLRRLADGFEFPPDVSRVQGAAHPCGEDEVVIAPLPAASPRAWAVRCRPIRLRRLAPSSRQVLSRPSSRSVTCRRAIPASQPVSWSRRLIARLMFGSASSLLSEPLAVALASASCRPLPACAGSPASTANRCLADGDACVKAASRTCCIFGCGRSAGF